MKYRPKQCPNCAWNKVEFCDGAVHGNKPFKGETERYCYIYHPKQINNMRGQKK